MLMMKQQTLQEVALPVIPLWRLPQLEVYQQIQVVVKRVIAILRLCQMQALEHRPENPKHQHQTNLKNRNLPPQQKMTLMEAQVLLQGALIRVLRLQPAMAQMPLFQPARIRALLKAVVNLVMAVVLVDHAWAQLPHMRRELRRHMAKHGCKRLGSA